MRGAGLLGETWMVEPSNSPSEARQESKLPMQKTKFVLPLLFALGSAFAVRSTAASSTSAARSLDNFEDLSPWTAQHTDDVTATLHGVDGKIGKALRLDFDFTGAHGEPIKRYATARRELRLTTH